MKILLIVLLCASFTTNAVLYMRTSRSHSDSVSTITLQGAISETSPSATPTAPAKINPEINSLLAANDPEAIAKLRALGFSEKAIRAIAVAQVTAQFRDRYRALEKKSEVAEYWKSRYQRFDPSKAAARSDLRRQEDAAIKKLLGSDYMPDLGQVAAARYAMLSPEKAGRVRAIEEDYQSMMMAAQASSGMGFVRFPEEQEKVAYLQKEERAELKQVLSPEELFEYDLRSSPIAGSLRFKLSAFEPTEQEFRAMFRISQETQGGANLNLYDPSGEGQVARRKAEDQFNEQLKTLLSTDRYADYQRNNNYDYKRFYQIASRLDLPRESAVAAQAVKTSTEQKRYQLMSEPAMRDPAQRTQALSALAEEAEASLRRILGDSGYEAYTMTPSNFLQGLRPRTMPQGKR